MPFAQNFFDSRFPVIDKTWRNELESLAKLVPNLKNQDNQALNVRSNTTVFAMKYKDGVLIAADRRTSDGNYGIAADDSDKIHQLTNFSAMGSAGYCNVISHLERKMRLTCSSFRALYGQELSPDGQANYLRNILEPWWFFFISNWYYGPGIPVLAAYDISSEKPRIFEFDDSGYWIEAKSFTGIGCGYKAISGLLRDRHRSDLNKLEAIELAMRAMLHSGVSSHGVSDSRIVLPKIATINKDGFIWQEGPLKPARAKIMKDVEGLR